MKYQRFVTRGKELSQFYKDLFKDANRSYGMIMPTHSFMLIPYKEAILPLPFLEIIETEPMQKANCKIQTAHSWKDNYRMEDTRLDHMIFAHALGVDLLNILEKKGYNIDYKTKIAFLTFLLIHDIGHGPFSHPFEQMVDGYKGMHEDIGRRTLKENVDLYNILESIYPGLTERVVNFEKYDKYGLSTLLEGTFDLDRAAFLIMDTFLSETENAQDDFYDILDSIYKIFNSIILKNGKVYFDISCFREMDAFLRIRGNNYLNIYQEEKRVLDDLLLKRLGERASIIVKEKKGQLDCLPEAIKNEIMRFINFIEHMKSLKANIPLREYYSFDDNDFERIFRMFLLLDDSELTHDALLMISKIEDFYKYYDILKNQEQNGQEDFYVINKIKYYKPSENERIIFLDGDEEVDYADCVGKTIPDFVITETISYIPKKPIQLFSEEELRNKLLTEINEALEADDFGVYRLVSMYPSDNDIIAIIREYRLAVCNNISLEEFAKSKNLTPHQVLAFLTMFTSNRIVSDNSLLLISSSLGYYFNEEEALKRINSYQKIK